MYNQHLFKLIVIEKKLLVPACILPLNTLCVQSACLLQTETEHFFILRLNTFALLLSFSHLCPLP